jgi:hypothetical protein
MENVVCSSAEVSEVDRGHFDDQWGIGTEIAVPQPARTDAQMDEAGPRQAFPPVRKYPEVLFLKSLELGAPRSVGLAFVLHRLLLALKTSDHERDTPVLLEIPRFAAGGDRVEHDLERIQDGDADDGGLNPRRTRRRLDGVAMRSKTCQESGAGRSRHSVAYCAAASTTVRATCAARTLDCFSTSTHSSSAWLRALLPRPIVTAGIPRLIGMLESVLPMP